MMGQAIREVTGLAITLVMSVGPLGLLVGLLNRRDRREAALLDAVAGQFSAVTVRSDITLQVRCRLLAGRAAVRVNMGACSREEIWEAITRLRRTLPAPVRLTVEGRVDHQPPARLTVEALTGGRGVSEGAVAPSRAFSRAA